MSALPYVTLNLICKILSASSSPEHSEGEEKKREKEAPAYKYKKHLSAQETLLCHFANDSYLYVQEKSDLMNHAGNDVLFCLALAVAVCSCTWLAGGLPWHRDLSSAAQCGPEAFMFPSYTFL